jgi:hypothetical protein
MLTLLASDLTMALASLLAVTGFYATPPATGDTITATPTGYYSQTVRCNPGYELWDANGDGIGDICLPVGYP